MYLNSIEIETDFIQSYWNIRGCLYLYMFLHSMLVIMKIFSLFYSILSLFVSFLTPLVSISTSFLLSASLELTLNCCCCCWIAMFAGLVRGFGLKERGRSYYIQWLNFAYSFKVCVCVSSFSSVFSNETPTTETKLSPLGTKGWHKHTQRSLSILIRHSSNSPNRFWLEQKGRLLIRVIEIGTRNSRSIQNCRYLNSGERSENKESTLFRQAQTIIIIIIDTLVVATSTD